MKPGPNRENGKPAKQKETPRQRPWIASSCRRPLVPNRWRPLALALLLLAGCASSRDHIDHNLLADKGTTYPDDGAAEGYIVGCPDVLQIVVPGRSDLCGRFTVGPDGRIEMEKLGRPRVEGRTVTEIARLLAYPAGIPPGQVRVRVADYQSQEVYLFGQVNGLQHAVPYRGQETVLDLLQRTGGITPGAAPAEVYVIRTRVAEGQRPEVFRVDLRAIVLNHDQRTNLRLRPFDQIHVGETRQARVERSIPPWLRPLYQVVWDTRPQEAEVRNQKSEIRNQKSDIGNSNLTATQTPDRHTSDL
jgi:polysaccharide biosynthesis/export protein